MSSQLFLVVFDPRTSCIVRDEFIGGDLAWTKAEDVLRGVPAVRSVGDDCWSDVTPTQVLAILEAKYVDALSPEEVTAMSEQFPTTEYWWMVKRLG